MEAMPELDELRLAEGTDDEGGVWFEEGGVEISASIEKPYLTEGGQTQKSSWTCINPHVDCLTGPVTVTWRVTGISTDRTDGTGTTASFIALEPGPALITFTASFTATLNEGGEDEEDDGACSPAAAPPAQPNTVTGAKEITVHQGAFIIRTRAMYEHPAPRSRPNIGVYEEVDCMVDPEPKGDVSWSVDQGGTIRSTDGGAKFTAGGETMDATIKADVAKVGQNTKPLKVMAPTGVQTVLKRVTVQQQQPSLEVVMLADTYIEPDTVNFGNAVFKEEICWAVASRYFKYQDKLKHDASLKPISGSVVVAGRGTLLAIPDGISGVSQGPPYDDGDFHWDIPVFYQDKAGFDLWRRAGVVPHHKKIRLNAQGKATLSLDKDQAHAQVTEP